MSPGGRRLGASQDPRSCWGVVFANPRVHGRAERVWAALFRLGSDLSKELLGRVRYERGVARASETALPVIPGTPGGPAPPPPQGS
eukprot:gene19315-biopygen17491